MLSAVSKVLRRFAFLAMVMIFAAAAFFAVARDEIADYRMVGRFGTVNAGDDTAVVVEKIGIGREAEVQELPTINSFQSRNHHDEVPHPVPVVEGHKIFIWEAWGCRFYVAFNPDGKVIDHQILDSNSL